MSIVSLKIPERLAAQLEQEAEAKHMSKSGIVREALAMYFASAPAGKQTIRALAGDLIGCFEGPGDLSTNKKHMAGYGK